MYFARGKLAQLMQGAEHLGRAFAWAFSRRTCRAAISRALGRPPWASHGSRSG